MATMIFVSLVPLIVFGAINYYKGLKYGVLSACVSSVVVGIILWLVLDYVDFELFLMIGFMLILGFFSVKSKNDLIFKLQPVLSSICTVLILAWYQFFDKPFFLKLLPKFEKLLPASQLDALQDPIMMEHLSRASLHMMIWVSVHAVLLAWAAKYRSTTFWIVVKALFLPFFIGAYLATEYVLKVV